MVIEDSGGDVSLRDGGHFGVEAATAVAPEEGSCGSELLLPGGLYEEEDVVSQLHVGPHVLPALPQPVLLPTNTSSQVGGIAQAVGDSLRCSNFLRIETTIQTAETKGLFLLSSRAGLCHGEWV